MNSNKGSSDRFSSFFIPTSSTIRYNHFHRDGRAGVHTGMTKRTRQEAVFRPWSDQVEAASVQSQDEESLAFGGLCRLSCRLRLSCHVVSPLGVKATRFSGVNHPSAGGCPTLVNPQGPIRGRLRERRAKWRAALAEVPEAERPEGLRRASSVLERSSSSAMPKRANEAEPRSERAREDLA